MNWQEKTYTFKWLETQALSSTHIGSMIRWLKELTVMPPDAKWNRGMPAAIVNLDPEAIPGHILASLAHEWDNEYEVPPIGTPREFINTLRFELRGSDKKAAVQEVLDSLGRKVPGPESTV